MADILVPRALLEAFYDESPCWFDHHGDCQGHGFTDLDGEPCPQVQIGRLLAQARTSPEVDRG